MNDQAEIGIDLKVLRQNSSLSIKSSYSTVRRGTISCHSLRHVMYMWLQTHKLYNKLSSSSPMLCTTGSNTHDPMTFDDITLMTWTQRSKQWRSFKWWIMCFGLCSTVIIKVCVYIRIYYNIYCTYILYCSYTVHTFVQGNIVYMLCICVSAVSSLCLCYGVYRHFAELYWRMKPITAALKLTINYCACFRSSELYPLTATL